MIKKRAIPKRLITRKSENSGGNRLLILDVKGKEVYSGYGRREFKELSYFDSESTNQRRFHLNNKSISKERRKQLKKYAEDEKITYKKKMEDKKTYPDARGTKHRKFYLALPEEIGTKYSQDSVVGSRMVDFDGKGKKKFFLISV